MNKIIRIRFTLTIFLFLFYCSCTAQNSLNSIIKSLHNEDLRYELIVTRPQYSGNKIKVSQYLVDIKSMNIDSLIKKFGKKKLIRTLIMSLNDDTKDWYANMLLYAITKKDATLFSVIDNRSEWVKNNNKKEDVKYWNNYQVD